MDIKAPYRVHVIVDTAYGQSLAALPADDPVWIVASAVNEPVVRQLWQERPGESHLDGITLFQSHGSSEESLLDILGSVDLHHGEHSATPPYSLLEVSGCPPSDKVRVALAELGFHVRASTENTFTAHRSAEQPTTAADGRTPVRAGRRGGVSNQPG